MVPIFGQVPPKMMFEMKNDHSDGKRSDNPVVHTHDILFEKVYPPVPWVRIRGTWRAS